MKPRSRTSARPARLRSSSRRLEHNSSTTARSSVRRTSSSRTRRRAARGGNGSTSWMLDARRTTRIRPTSGPRHAQGGSLAAIDSGCWHERSRTRRQRAHRHPRLRRDRRARLLGAKNRACQGRLRASTRRTARTSPGIVRAKRDGDRDDDRTTRRTRALLNARPAHAAFFCRPRPTLTVAA